MPLTSQLFLVAFDFTTVYGCDQLVVGPTTVRGGTLDLQMTDVLDLVRVAFITPISNSDHFSLSAVISMAQAVPNLCVSRRVLLKYQVNLNTICGEYWICPGVIFGQLIILLRSRTSILLLLVLRYVPTKVIHMRNKDSLCLMVNAG